MLLGVLGRISQRIPIFLLSVAAPHHVNGFLARKEVVGALHEHARVAHIHAHLVIVALAVAITEQTDLLDGGDNRLDGDADLVLGTALLLVVELVVGGNFIVPSGGSLRSATIANAEGRRLLIFTHIF